MAHPATIALANCVRWIGNPFCVLMALGMWAFDFGLKIGTLVLLGMGVIAALFLLFRPVRRLSFPGLATMTAVGLFSVVGLAIDRVTNGSIFAFKHSHFDGFYIGMPLVESHAHDGSILHIFMFDGQDRSSYYAIRSNRSWFPQVSYLPDGWKVGDP